jgi:hypothetical protein
LESSKLLKICFVFLLNNGSRFDIEDGTKINVLYHKSLL